MRLALLCTSLGVNAASNAKAVDPSLRDVSVSVTSALAGRMGRIVIDIETVDLEARNLRLPSDRVGMVIAQPFVPNESLTAAEPYRCAIAARQDRLAVLSQTLAISRANHHGMQKTHFTIFPEYSIPGPDGIALVETAVRANDWPNGTIVIGGTDGLTQAQYGDLLQGPSTHCNGPRNGADQVGDRWVNCAITWIKQANGAVDRWVQPKIHPAWPEMNIAHQHMFSGRSVYVFKGRFDNDAPFRFATLVCFDWVATVDAQMPFEWILSDLHNKADGAQLPLSWLFVIQRNQKPSHATFLTSVNRFFNQVDFPNALRDRACVVFANTAGKATPGRSNEFGGCSVVSSPQSLFQIPSCAPTFSGGGPRFRDGSNLLANCKDFVFRERGACIHSFVQINPASVAAGAGGRTFAVAQAQVFPTSGPTHPRAPNGAVPAAIKWINDELDSLPDLQDRYPAAPLAPTAATMRIENVQCLRDLASQAVAVTVELATQGLQSNLADDWNSPESEALGHVANTLDILRVALAPTVPNISGDPVHASIEIGNHDVDLIAVRGNSHDECVTHVNKLRPLRRRPTLLVSRDHDNTKWAKKLGNFLQPLTQPGDEPRITDPSSGMIHIGYQNLLEPFISAQNAAALAISIHAELAN